jgi:hypothetical protein
MKRFLLLMLCSVLLLASCSKEASMEQDNNPIVDPPVDTTTNATKKLLFRLVEYDESFPTDSSVTTYVYDNNKRLIGVKFQSLGPGNNDFYYSDDEHVLYRGADGILTRVTILSRYYEGGSFTRLDSATFEIFHDPVSKRYTYAIHKINLGGLGFVFRDSVTYTYDSKDRIILSQTFRKDTATNIFFEAQRYEYGFDAKGNMIKISSNENYDNQGDPMVETKIEYDDKINPLDTFKNDGLLLGVDVFGYPSSNNPIKAFEGNAEVSNFEYGYDAEKYPFKATLSYIGYQAKQTAYFYYQ